MDLFSVCAITPIIHSQLLRLKYVLLLVFIIITSVMPFQAACHAAGRDVVLSGASLSPLSVRTWASDPSTSPNLLLPAGACERKKTCACLLRYKHLFPLRSISALPVHGSISPVLSLCWYGSITRVTNSCILMYICGWYVEWYHSKETPIIIP